MDEAELRTLMIAGQQGDASAHRTLLSALGGHLRAYYQRKLVGAGRSPAETEDLVQEALMAVHTRRHTYEPAEPLTPWIHAIARYKLIDYLRKTRSTLGDVPIEDASELLASDEQIATESSVDLQKLLSTLPERVRLAIRYVKIEGLSVVEAAARCGISESAIKINVHRGLRALSAAISEESPK